MHHPTLGPLDRSGLHAVNREPMSSLRRTPEVPLDGPWEFQLRDHIDEVAPGWQEVEVPSLWTMHSAKDRPHYTNVFMPFDEAYPTIPARNPVGVYRRTFQVEPAPGRRLVLHVGAAEGQLLVTVNGVPVGTSSDSHLAAEFDLTAVVRPGENDLQLTVTKWSAVTYLEDQDQWWHGGISRSTYLYTVPQIALTDVESVADLDPETGRGALHLVATVAALRSAYDPEHTVRVTVLGESHDLAISARLPTATIPKPPTDRSRRPERQFPDDFMDRISLAAASAPVPPEFRAVPDPTWAVVPLSPPGTAVLELADLDVVAWSAENPHLEEVRVELVDGDGLVVDVTALRIGFRRVEVVGRDLLVNGARVMIQGVNRHDFDPRTGRVIAQDRMLAELGLLKRHNVNAIRTSHYPNDPAFLDLCDELGFYVVDEADIEGHAFASTIADDPLYLPEIVTRASRMVLRDRNHPSVIIWSLGNESGYGSAHDAAAAWVRHADPSRPVQYEGAVAGDWFAGHAASDIAAPMYPALPGLVAYATSERADRPMILAEYAYSQGNSTGGLDQYWALFESLPALQGGFIWEFADHALDPDGDGRSRFGGDFGDTPNSGSVLLNGLVFSDLAPKPSLAEVRAVFSPARPISDGDEALRGTMRLRNRLSFTDLAEYVIEVAVAGSEGTGQPLTLAPVKAEPGAEVRIDLPAKLVDALHSPTALGLVVRVRTGSESAWAPAGTVLAEHQIEVPRLLPVLPDGGRAPELDAQGEVRHPLLDLAPRLSLWRALTDNDKSVALDQRFVRSGFFHLDPVRTSVTQDEGEQVVEIAYEAAFGDPVRHTRRITQAPDGTLVFDEEVVLPEGTTDGLRVGVELQLAGRFDDATWVGLGPQENYADRRTGATLGRWSSAIDDLATPYVVPQENGTRGGVTELEVSGPAGRAAFTADVPLYANVARHTADELEGAEHWWQLPVSERTVVHLDVAHRGVGTGRIGPDTHPRYRLAGTRYRWRWSMRLDGSTPGNR